MSVRLRMAPRQTGHAWKPPAKRDLVLTMQREPYPD